jgi:peptide/nickel transport system permease protein
LIAKRLAFAVPTLLFVTFLVFALVNFAPGDAAVELAGENPTPERIQQIRDDLHLEDPLLVRYGNWLSDAVHGDFGTSVTSRQDVSSLIANRLEVTASLAAIALVMMIALALVFGILGALWPGGWIDRLITWVAALAIAAPPFWIGLVLVLLFAVNRSWFPAIGYTPLDEGISEWLRHLMLPAIALAALPAAELALQLKGALTEELGRDYLLAVRAKGMTSRSIVGKHALKNAAIPVVTVLGHRIAQLLGGAVTIEAVFVLPGLGSLAVASTINRDIPVLLSIVVISTLFVIIVNLLVDISYGYFNPKVRT